LSRELSASLRRNPDLDSWIRIGPRGRVGVFTGKAELGQGIKTAIARIAAEELDVSVERIDVQTADTASSPNELYTAGSSSVEESGNAVREAAAEARRRILARASEQLGVPVERLRVEDGTVSGPGGGRTTYWELMGGKAFHCRVSGEAPLKPPAAYRVVGKPGPRLDLREIVTGAHRFAQDLELADMVHGRVVRPPGHGSRLEALDDAAARRVPGVLRIVRDGSFVAAIAEREEQVLEAAHALRRGCRWSEPSPLPTLDEIFDGLAARPDASLHVVDGVPVDEPIPPVEAPESAAATLRATYYRPYQMHASLGPSAAAARLAAGELTVWTHAQGVHVLRPALAQVLGMESGDVRVVHVPGPGCYGHNGAEDVALDAALLARALPGRPVLVQWTREDEHAWEPYGPAMVVQLQASLDRAGAVIDWNCDVFSNTHMGRALPFGDASNLLAAWHRDPPRPAPRPRPNRGFHAGIHRNADPLYAFSKRRIAKHLVETMPLRVSSTRSLGAFANVFAIESFMDELAHAAGADPVEFRLRHLTDERARGVIEAAAARAGWSEPRPPGRGRGIGFARYKNQKCYAAVVVELEVEPESGAIHLERVVVAADAGQIVDPDGLASQLEGGVIQAASWTLKEEVRFDRQRITSTDWESYPILTLPEAPEIETVLIDRPGAPSLGSGEAAQGPTPAAIANAVFDATGVRLRRMPFRPERVRAARAAAGR
jgi:CO/xanthine dehydrogenase Mo-binding subunit